MERRRAHDTTEGEEGKRPEYERQLRGETEGQRGEGKMQIGNEREKNKTV